MSRALLLALLLPLLGAALAAVGLQAPARALAPAASLWGLDGLRRADGSPTTLAAVACPGGLVGAAGSRCQKAPRPLLLLLRDGTPDPEAAARVKTLVALRPTLARLGVGLVIVSPEQPVPAEPAGAQPAPSPLPDGPLRLRDPDRRVARALDLWRPGYRRAEEAAVILGPCGREQARLVGPGRAADEDARAMLTLLRDLLERPPICARVAPRE